MRRAAGVGQQEDRTFHLGPFFLPMNHRGFACILLPLATSALLGCVSVQGNQAWSARVTPMMMPVLNRPWPMYIPLSVVGPVFACLVWSCHPADLFVAPPLHDCAGSPSTQPVRVMTYNIRSGKSGSLDQIAMLIAAYGPDVVALQEVDRDVATTGGVDQAQELADRLGYDYAFAAALNRHGGHYGVALLSRLPFASADRLDLLAPFSMEPRTAIDASLCIGDRPIRVVATHADVLPWSSTANARALADYVLPSVGKGLLVLGDLNALPNWEGPRALVKAGLKDLIGELAEGPTFVGDPLRRRIDYIFADQPLAALAVAGKVISQTASDHLPVLVDLDLTRGW